MNAPVPHLAATPDAPYVVAFSTRAILGLDLYDRAMRGEVALSDRYGCWTALAEGRSTPLTRTDMDGGHRVAVDLAQGHAQRLDAACRAALARAEKVAEHGTGDEAHAALAEISDMIASALVGVPPAT